MNRLTFWAQGLDNLSSSELISRNGKFIDPKKQLGESQEILSLIYKVSANKESKLINISKKVKIYIGKEEFVLEIILREKDELKRRAPIICYGELAEPDDQYFLKNAMSEIELFIREIERTLPKATAKDVEEALSFAKKKSKSSRIALLVAAVILFFLLVLFAVLFFISFKTG